MSTIEQEKALVDRASAWMMNMLRRESSGHEWWLDMPSALLETLDEAVAQLRLAMESTRYAHDPRRAAMRCIEEAAAVASFAAFIIEAYSHAHGIEAPEERAALTPQDGAETVTIPRAVLDELMGAGGQVHMEAGTEITNRTHWRWNDAVSSVITHTVTRDEGGDDE